MHKLQPQAQQPDNKSRQVRHKRQQQQLKALQDRDWLPLDQQDLFLVRRLLLEGQVQYF
jgi:hypothetical protein